MLHETREELLTCATCVKESRTDSWRGVSCSWAAWTFSWSFRLSSCRAKSSSRAWTSSSSYWHILCSCSSCSDCRDEIWKERNQNSRWLHGSSNGYQKKEEEEGGNLQVGSPGWSAVECEWAAPPGRPSVGPAHLKHLEPSDAEPEVAAILRFPLPPHLEGPVDIKSKGGGKGGGREIQ